MKNYALSLYFHLMGALSVGIPKKIVGVIILKKKWGQKAGPMWKMFFSGLPRIKCFAVAPRAVAGAAGSGSSTVFARTPAMPDGSPVVFRHSQQWPLWIPT